MIPSERRRAASMLLLLMVAAVCMRPSSARAEEQPRKDLLKRFGVRVNGGVAFFVSRDQLDWLGFSRPGAVGDLAFSMLVTPWLSAELGGTIGVFMSNNKLALVPEADAPGGLLSPWLGLRVHGQSRKLPPHLGVNFGPGFTGDLVRSLLQMNLGADVGLGRGASLGPIVGFSQLFQKNRPGASTDARFLWVGLSFTYRPLPDEPKVVTRYVHTVERVVDTVERVVEVPRDEVPSPAFTPPAPVDDGELSDLLDRALPTPPQRVELLAPVLFAFDSDRLEPLGVAMLHEVAAFLKRRDDIELVAIHGYADKRGSAEYNRALSTRRAERVREWLIAHGVAGERLLVAEGGNDLVEQGDSEAAHQQNRRVIFRVLRVAGAAP